MPVSHGPSFRLNRFTLSDFAHARPTATRFGGSCPRSENSTTSAVLEHATMSRRRWWSLRPGSSDSSDRHTSRKTRHVPLAPTASRLVKCEKISESISRGRVRSVDASPSTSRRARFVDIFYTTDESLACRVNELSHSEEKENKKTEKGSRAALTGPGGGLKFPAGPRDLERTSRPGLGWAPLNTLTS